MKIYAVIRQRSSDAIGVLGGSSGGAIDGVSVELPRDERLKAVKRPGGSIKANRRLDEQLRHAKPFSEIPSTPGCRIPYLGSYFNYKKPFGKYNAYTFTDSILDNYKKYGKIYKDKLLGVDSVNVLDLDAVKTIYHHEGKVPHVLPIMKTIKYHRELRNLSPGLGNSNGDYWYNLRKAAQSPLMEPQSAYGYLDGQNRVADEFVRDVLSVIRNPETGSVKNIENELARWTLESMANLAFDKRLGSFTSKYPQKDLSQKLIDHNHTFFRDSLKLQFALPMDKFLYLSKTWKRAIQSYDYFFDQGQLLVDEALFNLQTISEKRALHDNEFTFLRKLLLQKNFSYKDLSMISISLLVDSLKTTGSTIAGQLYMLACNPEKQEILFEEISKICPDINKHITRDQIEHMVYLKAIIKESLRMLPNAIDITRITQKDLVICGYKINKGTIVNLYHPLLLRDPEYIKDPEEFQPERWLPGATGDINPFLHLPFGFGFRSCPGRRVAELDMSLLMIKIVHRYRLSTVGSANPESEYVFLKLYNSLPLALHSREL